MQTFQHRCLILAALLAAASVIMVGFDRPQAPRAARYPAEDAIFMVGDWEVGPPTTESANGVTIMSRMYWRADGMVVSLTLSTSPEAKRIYRAGADVPLLGNGYTVNPAPPSLVPPADARAAIIAQRGGELGLLLYGYGERRGFLGNGLQGWGLALFDATLARPNDYYVARAFTRLDGRDPSVLPDVVSLVGTVFPRLEGWYARWS